MEPGVDLGDPVELGALVVGEIAGVLPERVAGAGDAERGASGSSSLGRDGRDRVSSRCLVPGSASFDIERFDAPRDDVERIGAAQCVRGSLGDDAGDPARHVRRNMGQQGSAFVAELVEEHLQIGVGAARAGPHQMSGVVIDHDDQVAVPALVGDLIDPDPTQPIEAIDSGFDVVIDPGDDRADRAPRHPQQLTGRGLRGAHRQPRRQVIEVAGVADTVTSPRHRHHRRAMSAAPDPWSVGFDEHLRRAGIQRPPPPPTITVVVARRTSMAASAPATSLRVRSCRHHDRAVGVINADPFHDRARQTARLLPYLGVQHPVCLPVDFEPSTARNLGIRRGAPADRPSTHPRIEQESGICARCSLRQRVSGGAGRGARRRVRRADRAPRAIDTWSNSAVGAAAPRSECPTSAASVSGWLLFMKYEHWTTDVLLESYLETAGGEGATAVATAGDAAAVGAGLSAGAAGVATPPVSSSPPACRPSSQQPGSCSGSRPTTSTSSTRPAGRCSVGTRRGPSWRRERSRRPSGSRSVSIPAIDRSPGHRPRPHARRLRRRLHARR